MEMSMALDSTGIDSLVNIERYDLWCWTLGEGVSVLELES
jgi:hypothetical protein